MEQRPDSHAIAQNDEQFDSGEVETLPDGSISVPVIEEELVVTKRLVVRERIIVHKDAEIERFRVDSELRRERVETSEVPADADAGRGPATDV